MLQCRDIDDLMMDWLYEELDEDASEGVETHAEQCARCANELNSLKQTRQACREIPEEEPPAALSAILLHEAARRAPASSPVPIGEESPGLLERFLGLFRPLALHPAATAVATLLVIGGVFGTLYVRQGGHDVATPTASSGAAADETASEGAKAPAPDPAPEEAGEAERAAPLEESESPRMVRGSEDSYAADLLDSERRRELDDKVAEADTAGRGARAERPDREARQKGARGSRLEAKKKRPRPSTKRRSGNRENVPSANAVTGADPLIASGDAPQGAPPAKDDADGEAQNERFRPYAAKELAWAKQQEARLSKAVSKKRCRRAADIANDILDRNPEYYTKRVKGSEEVQECRWYVRKERSQRLARRRAAKKASEGGKSGKASRQQAAPMRDEAATVESNE